MASISANASSVVSAGTWLTTTNVYTSNDTYATNTGATQNTEYPMDVGGFDFSAIPAGSTINSTTVSVERKAGTASRSQDKIELLDNVTSLGTAALTAITNTTDAARTLSATATLAQLQSANLKVRYTNKRTVSQANTTSVDHVKIDVVYTPIPPAITQAAYRFYADGTETGSTALAAQDTAPTVDTSGGDVNAQLRMRLQETAGGTPAATDDWQLQWEKNTSGTWTNAALGAGVLHDSYPSANRNADVQPYVGGQIRGQSFLGDGHNLTRAGFFLAKVGTPIGGNLRAVLYAHTGTFGVSGLGTGPVLATSLTSKSVVSDLATASAWHYFDFDGAVNLANGVPYVIGVLLDTTLDGSNTYKLGVDNTTPTHDGTQQAYASPTWTKDVFTDVIFEVYTVDLAGATVVPYDSANLTDGAATTNRLGAGTGSFVAGKVSEDGLVDDLGWSASNFTEVLYSLTLKQADLAPSDTLRFRVLKNGATTDLTYTSYPSVTIGAGGPATINAVVALTASSTLTTTAVPERAAAVALSATSTLSVTGTVTGAPVTVEATAALSATSTLTATAFEQAQGAVSLFAASTLTTTAVRFAVQLATVPLTAASTLTATAVRVPQAGVSLVAGSTLTTDAVRASIAAAALTAASTLTAAATTTAAPVIAAAVALTGVSALSVSATVTAAPVITATVALVASSTLTAAAVREPQAAVSLTASSTLLATVERVRPAVVSLAATSVLSATGVPERAAAVPLAAVSTLTVTAVGITIVPAAVGLSATSTLTATAVRQPQAAVSLTAASSLTTTADRIRPATVALTGSSTLTTTALRIPQAGVSLTASSTLTTTALRTATATVALVATSTLTPTAVGVGVVLATAALTGTSSLTVAAVRIPQAAVSLTASSTLTATAVRTRPATVALTASSTLTATALRTPVAAVSLTASSTLTVAAVRVRPAAVALTGTSTLTAVAAALGFVPAVAALTASSTLTVLGRHTHITTTTLTATALLTVQGVRVRPAAVTLTASSTLVAIPERIKTPVVPLIASSTLTVYAVRSAGGAIGLVATATLTTVATIQVPTAILRDVALTGYLHALDTDHIWYPVTTRQGITT